MSSPADVALSHLKKLLSRDPMLRDILADALPALSRGPGFAPDVDVWETEHAHVVQIDLPGVPQTAVKVKLEGARLVVEGKRERTAPEGAAARSMERGFGGFRREFLLPTDIDADAVSARFEDGVLTVTVPRVHTGGREVPISS